jgi:hypothetical protein
VAALDRRSVQHMGTQGLAAAVRLAEGGTPGGGGERIYSDVAGRVLVVLPRTLGLAAFGLLLAGIAAFAWSRRDGLLRGLGAVLAAIAGSALAVLLLQWLVGLARPGAYWRAHPEAISLGIDLAALAVSAAVLAALAGSLTRERLRAAFWLAFMLLSLVMIVVAPGAAIFALLPPLLMLIGWLAGYRAPRAETVAAVLAWATLFLIWGPLIHLIGVLLDFGAAWVFAPLAALIVLPALIELKPLGASRAPALAAVGLGALALWAAVLVLPAYSDDRKQGFRIEYAWDADAAKGQWLVANGGAGLPQGFPGGAAFRPDVKIAWSGAIRWAAPGPAFALPAPRLDHVAERREGPDRVVAVRIATNGAEDVLFRFAPDSGLKAVRTGGANAALGKGAPKDPYFVRCTGRSCDGAVMEFILSGGPAEATLVGIRNALPSAAAPLVKARPATAQAQYSHDNSMSWTKVTL